MLTVYRFNAKDAQGQWLDAAQLRACADELRERLHESRGGSAPWSRLT